MKKIKIFEDIYLPLILKTQKDYSLKKGKVLLVAKEAQEKYHKDMLKLEEQITEWDNEQELDDILNKI